MNIFCKLRPSDSTLEELTGFLEVLGHLGGTRLWEGE